MIVDGLAYRTQPSFSDPLDLAFFSSSVMGEREKRKVITQRLKVLSQSLLL